MASAESKRNSAPHSTNSRQQRTKQITQILLIATHIGAFLPLTWLFYQWWNYLLVDEMAAMTATTGTGGLILLLLCLTVTPLNNLTGWREIVPLRKWLGLYAFIYVTLHLLVFVVPIIQFDPSQLVNEVLLKKYALVGFTSFLIMLPLALTSNQWSMKRLKKKWKQLHQLVYVAAVLAIIHFFWLVKVGAYNRPIFYGSLLALLFVLRVPFIRRKISEWRRKVKR